MSAPKQSKDFIPSEAEPLELHQRAVYNLCKSNVYMAMVLLKTCPLPDGMTATLMGWTLNWDKADTSHTAEGDDEEAGVPE